MSDQTSVNVQAQDQDTTSTEGKEVRGPFVSIEEANQSKPTSDKFKLFRVTSPSGAVHFCWGQQPNNALAIVARKDGYGVHSAGKSSADKVADLLSQLSPAEREALLAKYATNGQQVSEAEEEQVEQEQTEEPEQVEEQPTAKGRKRGKGSK